MSVAFIHHWEPGAEKRPILLLLHGTGGTENDLIDLGHSLAPGAGLLSPRGKTLENGMPRFFRRLAEGVFDEADLIARTHELADFITEKLNQENASGRPVIAVGYSNGANIAASLLLLRPGILAGAVLFRSMIPLTPNLPADLSNVQILLAAGQLDPLVPVENVSRLAEMLREAGATVELAWNPGGHELHAEEIERARSWLAENFPTH